MHVDTPSTSSRALLALAAASFGIDSTEFVIMGLLPDVAHDLRATIPQAGLLVSGYALGVVFGAPILAVATARLDRRRALLLLIGIFILGNCLCAIAPSYALLMGARIVTEFSHGAFFGLGAVVAANVVPSQKRSQAIALMFTGLALGQRSWCAVWNGARPSCRLARDILGGRRYRHCRCVGALRVAATRNHNERGRVDAGDSRPRSRAGSARNAHQRARIRQPV